MGGVVTETPFVTLSNFPFFLTNEDLKEILEIYGTVIKIHRIKDWRTGNDGDMAIIIFSDNESANRCVAALNEVEILGRKVSALIAHWLPVA
ncbi:hypothetical protein TNIN_468131 [Trichonephila inaurata madagascariensis]|uniref:RRM domain-containing protein n=1 Tax=Trichonephila inaurata madagascariensis TaxID=2747483 RepID=A0A8X6X9D1_9ARAC|nr:hypothetical protein TNIN_468131 [Trichonephila inaurata madagascariensis]